MPYTIQENDGQYCVYKVDDDGGATGDSLGCHDTQEQAAAQIGAIEANEKGGRLRSDQTELFQDTYAAVLAETGDKNKADLAAWGMVHRHDLMKVQVKSLTADGVVIGGWGMLFTDEENLDLAGTYFSQETQTLLDFYKDAPLFVEHDGTINMIAGPIGKRIRTEVYPRGIWAEHQLFSDHLLYNAVIDDITAGLYSYSSDSMGHYVEPGYDDHDGHLRVWPIAAWSITKTPAEPGLGPVSLMAHLETVKSAAQVGRDALVRDGVVLNDSTTIDPSNDTRDKDTIMNMKDTAAALKAFLKMDEEAAIEEVVSELESLIDTLEELTNGEPTASRMDDEDEERAAKADVDPVALRLALGLSEDASDEEVVNVLSSIIAMLSGSPEAEPVASRRSYDYGALRTVAQAAKNHAPAITPKLPAYTSKVAKSERRHAPAFNKGVDAPGIMNLVSWMKHPYKHASKAQSYQLGPTGGYVLNQEVSSEIIPLLRSKTFFDDLGVNILNMNGVESLTINRHTTPTAATWVGEGQTITGSNVAFNQITLNPRPLAALVDVPNRALANADINFEQFIRDDITQQIAIALQTAALFGTGATTSGNTGREVLGIVNTPGVTSTALNALPDFGALSGAVERLESANITESDTWGWLFSPRTKSSIVNQTSTTGEPLMREMWARGAERELMGIKYNSTTIVPNNTVGSTDGESYVFLGDWRYLQVGLSGNVEFIIDPTSLASTLTTRIVAYMYADIAVHYGEAFEVLTDVRAS